MAKSWKQVRAEAGLDERKVAAARRDLLGQVRSARLAEIRRSRSLTQELVAREMGVTQTRVSQIERGRLDASEVATLAAYVEAIGGRLRLVADFGDESVVVDEPEVTRPSAPTTARGRRHQPA